MIPLPRPFAASLLCLPLLASCASLNLYSQAVASESFEPTEERSLVSGDFTITSNLASSQIAGDGRDEQTTWDFTFRASAMEHVLKSAATLNRATLTLVILPSGGSNEVITLMKGKDQLMALLLDELLPDLPDDTTSKVATELPLSKTNDKDQSLRDLIHQHIQTGTPLAFRYEDDARISLAKLKLEYK